MSVSVYTCLKHICLLEVQGIQRYSTFEIAGCFWKWVTTLLTASEERGERGVPAQVPTTSLLIS